MKINCFAEIATTYGNLRVCKYTDIQVRGTKEEIELTSLLSSSYTPYYLLSLVVVVLRYVFTVCSNSGTLKERGSFVRRNPKVSHSHTLQFVYLSTTIPPDAHIIVLDSLHQPSHTCGQLDKH